MNIFFEKNKIFLAIITTTVIVGASLYYLKNHKIATPSSSSGCISFKDAGDYIGDNKCVEGKVDNVFTSGKGNTFLNFCPDYSSCSFSIPIFYSNKDKFSDLKNYEGKNIQITGLIENYQGRAEIIPNNQSQIKIVNTEGASVQDANKKEEAAKQAEEAAIQALKKAEEEKFHISELAYQNCLDKIDSLGHTNGTNQYIHEWQDNGSPHYSQSKGYPGYGLVRWVLDNHINFCTEFDTEKIDFFLAKKFEELKL
ncbi:MAG: hypothetical protein NT170_03895 [Candidatus Moranbacteria bacterium]|nr:hypothetical protein [Candidatus Moranbacteria bacterium]